MLQRHELSVSGRVQGVGFRPFVYRLATHLNLYGWVRNENGQVRIQIQGQQVAIDSFLQRLLRELPPTAQAHILQQRRLSPTSFQSFSILDSEAQGDSDIHLPPDFYACPDCLAEMRDPANARYQYPFINCTACGPRYSIIKALPYDRANTSMATFPLCQQCLSEYTLPGDRRFHAEPIACPRCGPQLRFESSLPTSYGMQALIDAVSTLQRGELVIIKGIGGYHICCDAANAQAIAQLRERKQRPDKPLAVMFPTRGEDELDFLRENLQLHSAAIPLLRSPQRPIVLLTRRTTCNLAQALAPGLQELGAMLAYSPLHDLLLSRFGKPMVVTSANISGEPVLTREEDIRQRLAHISQYVLHHDRPIQRPVDDAVYRVIAQQARPLRLGRGVAPLELCLTHALPRPVLACGGHMKNTLAIAWKNRVVISAHIGDLDNVRSQQVFAQCAHDLQSLYQVEAELLLHDRHGEYFSSRWAQQQAKATLAITHHHAHASQLAGEYPEPKHWLVFTWDGVGLGEDATLWGGEALLGRPGSWRRAASWRHFKLPGGDRVSRQGWRSALALAWECDLHEQVLNALNSHLPHGEHVLPTQADIDLLKQAWQKGINSWQSSAVGRLFDAAAALLGLCHKASYEGQAPQFLEHMARNGKHPGIKLALIQDGTLWRSDWHALLLLLLDNSISVADRAFGFHASLAKALIDQAQVIRHQYATRQSIDENDIAIGLAGGVFQNQLLCQQISEQCQQLGWPLYIPQQLPVNDAGLSYGQVIEALARLT